MQKTEPGRFQPSWTLSAGALTQVLAAVACFLGAFVLPLTVPEFGGQSRVILLILGTVMLALGVLNILYGRQVSRVLTRAGKRSRVVVPREGIVYLAIMLVLAVGALLGHRNMPLLVFGMMAGPFVMNGWIVYVMLKGVTVRRRAPRRATVGEFLVVEIEVANSKRVMASHMLEVRDRIDGNALRAAGRDQEGTVTFVRVPGRQQRVGRYQVRFVHRGLYRLGPLRISSRFPLGIGERGQVFNDIVPLIVHPRQGRLLPTWHRQQKELAESSRRVQGRLGLFDDEFHRIREFREDDNPRSIHWRSSAKRGQLMVREYQQQRHADSLLVLDLPAASDWSREAMEMAISLAATLCVEQTRSSSGKRFLLAIAGETVQIVSSRTPGAFREEALDALAVCQPSAKADPARALTAIVQEHSLTDERILLITPRTQHAFDGLHQVTAHIGSDTLNLVGRTTLIEADVAALRKIFLSDTTIAGSAKAAV